MFWGGEGFTEGVVKGLFGDEEEVAERVVGVGIGVAEGCVGVGRRLQREVV